MRIEIELTATHPPSGSARSGDVPAVPFEGWLGMMRAIERLIGEPPADGPVARGAGGNGGRPRRRR